MNARLLLVLIAIFAIASCNQKPKTQATTTPTTPTEANLVINGSFEDGRGKIPSYWAPTGLASDSLGMAWELADFAFNGQRVVWIENKADLPLTWFNWRQIVQHFQAKKTVKLVARVKVEDVAGQAYIRVTCQGKTEAPLIYNQAGHISGIQDWQEISTTAYIPDSTESILIQVGLYGKGKAYFDDVKLIEIDEAEVGIPSKEQLLLNPGFEQGLNGWKETNHPDEFVSFYTDTLAYQGLNCGYISNEHPIGEADFNNYSQVVDGRYVQNKVVQFSAWVKTKGVSQYAALAILLITPNDMKNLFSSQKLTGDNEWTFISTELFMLPGTVSIIPKVGFYGAGEMWIDDVKLSIKEQ